MSVLVAMDRASLDAAMPMHLTLDAVGQVTGMGPTLAKAAANAGVALDMAALFEVAEFRKPSCIVDMASLGRHTGRPLRLTLRGTGAETLRLRGVAVPISEGGVLMNLTFGIDAVAAVARHGLTMQDFAPTDATPELLWLVEARAAAHRELLTLADRLDVARQDAEELSRADALTGLRNRRALDQLLARLHDAGADYAVLSVDLDLFKGVNDRHGHAAGDEVLRAAAGHLTAAARRDDVVARAGGDEFVMVMRGEIAPERLGEIARGLIDGIETPVPLEDGARAAISASVGIARSRDIAHGGPDAVVEAADTALYAAKRAGRGRWAMHGDGPVAANDTDDPRIIAEGLG